jgi:Na+/proline symporter
LVVAVAGAVAGLSALGLGAVDAISVDTTASLGVASILCSLIAIPIGVVGWKWAERRRRQSAFGQAAGLIGGTTLTAWFVLFVYALSQDTP